MTETQARWDRIEEKLDRIADRLTAHSILHERNTVSLEEHIRRTDALEKRQLSYEERQADFEKVTTRQLAMALLPIKSVKWMAAALIGLAAVVTAVKALLP